MRKLVLPIIALFSLTVFLGASSPSHVSATSTHHAPHLFRKPSQHGSAALNANNVSYHGGRVVDGTMNVYTIFWEPTNNVQAGYNSLINRYFTDVNGHGLYNNNKQYHDSIGRYPYAEHLAGTFTSHLPYPESPLLDSDIQAEVIHAQQVKGWTSRLHNVFFVFLQSGEDLCTDNTGTYCATNYFCAYHSAFDPLNVYAAMPYDASFSGCNPGASPNHNDADQTINPTSHEQMEIATDPLLEGWYDSLGNEIGDKCYTSFGYETWNGHTYYVQREWDNHQVKCVLSGP